jgi:DNA-binding NarL/FixJ family response regulator
MRIILADDHAMMRQCLKVCLATQPGLEIVGEAADGVEALELTRQLRPDVLVADVSMPRMNGIELTRQVSDLQAATRVLALSMHVEREFVREMFRAGASGYVVKAAAYDELVAALETLKGGRTYVSPAVAAVLVDSIVNPEPSPDGLSNLSSREREILGMVASGLNTKEIAYELGISDKTVHAYRKRGMKKLDVGSIADLTKLAIRSGLTVLE